MAVARVASLWFGVRRVKITGGEPLLRNDLTEIVQGIREHEDEISLTTNGTLLSGRAADLADAGLDRVNVSLDSLKEERYDFVTSSSGNLPKVVEGVWSAIDAGLTPVKLNTVLLQGINEDEVADLINFVRACNKRGGGGVAILQLIELMPYFSLNAQMQNYKTDFSAVEAELKSRATAVKTRRLQRRKKYFVGGAEGVDGVEVEVVHPIDNTEFCANCSRLRVTSDGKIKPCLLRDDNLVPLEGAGVDEESEEEIAEKLRLAVRCREPFFCKNE